MSGILALLNRGALSASPGPDADAASGPVSRGAGPVSPHRLERLTAAMAYRAPDGLATWRDGPVGMGHALFRTGTLGEQREAGVTHDPEAALHVVADARLDDRASLVRALRDAGASGPLGRPTTDTSDAELILAAWRAWGPDCAGHLAGDFAFVLWDARRRALFAARDPFGVKPLFVAEARDGDGDWLVVSNTLPAILAHPGVSTEPDELSLADHLFWGGIHDERRTTFAAVRQVERGSWLLADAGGLREGRHARLPEPAEPDATRAAGDVLEEFDALLRSSVADRLPGGDAPAVLQLSGGLDSGTIAAAAVAVRGGPTGLPALTVGYRRLFADPEPRLATLGAGALGLEHTVLWADDWVEPVPGTADALPQWALDAAPAPPLGPGFDLADLHNPPTAARGRVTLTGWDGDALLRGDTRGHLAGLARRGRLLRLGRALGLLADQGLRQRRPPRTGLRTALRSRGADDADPMEGYPEGLLDPDFERRCDLREHWRAAVARPGVDSDDPRAVARAALESPVWSGLFQEQDPGFTGQLVDARHPFMDARLVRFFLALPPVPWCVEKGLLRRWLESRLPPEIWRRTKQGLQGDPLVIDLGNRMADPDRRRDLAARIAPNAQDPAVARRLLLEGWRDAFLRGLEADDGGGMLPYWGTRAHALSRWLDRLERRASPGNEDPGRGHDGAETSDKPEALPHP